MNNEKALERLAFLRRHLPSHGTHGEEMFNAFDYVEAALRSSTPPEALTWIPVEERMPPKDGTASFAFFPAYSGYVARQDMQPIYWTGEGWQVSISGHHVYERFTHWMPLPQSPSPLETRKDKP